jgi:hypothetical protein
LLYLSVQIKPSSYLALLKQAAAGGQSISDFVDVSADEMPEEEYGEYYQDDDEDPTLLGEVSGAEYEDQAQDDGPQPHAEPELNEANPHEYDTSYENTEGGQEQHDRQDQYDQYDEVQQAEFELQQTEDQAQAQQAADDAQQAEFELQQTEDQAQQAPDDAQQAESEAYENNEGQQADVTAEHAEVSNDAQPFEEVEETSYVVADDAPVDLGHEVQPSVVASALEVTGDTTGEALHGEEEDQDTAKTSNVKSAASSTTLRDVQANDDVDNHSEYKDEDLIDWNDSILTIRPSGHDVTDDNDFSNFLAENGLESADVDTTNEENQRTMETESTNVGTVDEYDHAPEGHDDTADTAGIDFEDDEFEHHAGDADQETPAEAADAVANGTVQAQPETQASANGVANSTSELRVTPEAEQPQAKVSSSNEPVRNNEDYIDFDDEDAIDFDDDTYEEHEARKASEANSPGPKSPSGKRPLDEAGDDEQPELKKVKSS